MHNERKYDAIRDELIPARRLRKGDRTPWYSILSVKEENGKVFVDLLYHDGGTGARVFDNPDLEVYVSSREEL